MQRPVCRVCRMTKKGQEVLQLKSYFYLRLKSRSGSRM
jgi:hypothetical protein